MESLHLVVFNPVTTRSPCPTGDLPVSPSSKLKIVIAKTRNERNYHLSKTSRKSLIKSHKSL